jgi:hypothetical protein
MSCCATAQSNCLVFGILELVGIDEQSTCCETVATAAPAVLAGSVVDPALVVQLCAEMGCRDAVTVAVASVGISEQQIAASGLTCSEVKCEATGGNMAPIGSQSSCDGVYDMQASCNFICCDGMYPTGRHQCLASGLLAGGVCSSFESINALEMVVERDLNWNIIRQMVNLERVQLQDPEVQGWIPDNICSSLPKLNTIAVVGSKISGTLSSSLWECELLRHLDISSTFISGTIPVPPQGSTLPLHTLAASDTSLSGTLPSLSSSQAPALERLIAAAAHISGTLPTVVPPTIRDYLVADNRIGGTVPDLDTLQWLERFDLITNRISGTVPRLSRALVFLDFENNAVSGSLPADAHALRSLEVLSLGGNRISSTIPDSYSNLNPGAILSINANRIFGLIPSKMTEIVGLYVNFDGQHLCPSSSAANAREYACKCKRRWTKTVPRLNIVISYVAYSSRNIDWCSFDKFPF